MILPRGLFTFALSLIHPGIRMPEPQFRIDVDPPLETTTQTFAALTADLFGGDTMTAATTGKPKDMKAPCIQSESRKTGLHRTGRASLTPSWPFRQEPGVVFAWIDAEKAEFPITKLCQYLQAVSPSGFYAARGRPESARTQTDLRLRVLVRASFDESHQRYGSPRIHEDLMMGRKRQYSTSRGSV